MILFYDLFSLLHTAAYCPTTRRRYIFHLQRYTFLAVPQTFSPYYYLQKQNTHDNRKKYIHPQCFCQTLKMLLPKPTTIATVPRSFAAWFRLPSVPAIPPVPSLPSCSPQLGCGARSSLPCAYIYNMYALPIPLTQVKESPEKSFFLQKNPRKVCVFGKKCVPLHPLSTNTAVRRMPTEAHRRYLKDLQYRQTVQEAGIGLRAAWQRLVRCLGKKDNRQLRRIPQMMIRHSGQQVSSWQPRAKSCVCHAKDILL